MPRIDHPSSPIPVQLKGLHLFHFDGAPCAQRVRFALGEKGLHRGREERFDAVTASACAAAAPGHWVSRRVSLAKKDHLTEAYAAIHPNMVVPALVHDGVLYLESPDIIRYLDDAFGAPRLIPDPGPLHDATIARVNEAITLHRSIRFVTFRWGLGRLAMLSPKERQHLAALAQHGNDGEKLVEFYNGYSTRSIPESTYFDHLRNLYGAFQDVNQVLQDGRQFMMGDAVTIADAFWAMKVLRLVECGYPFAEHHPAVAAWFERVRQRPSFQQEVMGSNHLGHGFFRLKAGFENLVGIGLHPAVESICTRSAA